VCAAALDGEQDERRAALATIVGLNDVREIATQIPEERTRWRADGFKAFNASKPSVGGGQ
jgi:hypothetical protein